MRLAACVGVKDEAELIAGCLDHLRSIGVDLIIAIDAYSTDGTAEILESYAREEDVWFTQMSDLETHEAWVQANLELLRRAEADWAVFLDADEFLIPASGRLHDSAMLESSDVMRIHRFNVPLTSDGPGMPGQLTPDRYHELLLLAEPIPEAEFWSLLERDPERSWIEKQVMPRVLARVEKIESLSLGAHDVVTSQSISLRRGDPPDLLIAHLPLTTTERFHRKVDNIRRLFPTHDELFGNHSARHWRRWAELADQGELDSEFDRAVFSAECVATLRTEGAIRSAREIFFRRGALPSPSRTGSGH